MTAFLSIFLAIVVGWMCLLVSSLRQVVRSIGGLDERLSKIEIERELDHETDDTEFLRQALQVHPLRKDS